MGGNEKLGSYIFHDKWGVDKHNWEMMDGYKFYWFIFNEIASEIKIFRVTSVGGYMSL